MRYPEPDPSFRCVTSLTPTVCDLCGVRRPAQCGDEPIAALVEAAQEQLHGGKIEKVLIFAPDAVGIHLWEKFPEQLSAVEAIAPWRIPIRVVMPSVTPVCFGSMFSGALPEVHGIREYAKPVLTCETIFNVFPEAGRKTAIAAVNGCSIDTIFRKRPVTYVSTTKDADTLAFSEHLLRQPEYDFLLSYAYDYDHAGHAGGPFSADAIAAFNTDLDSFQKLAALADEVWADHNHLIVFAPDHGQHDTTTGRGSHGLDIPEDMLVYHFYAIRPARR